MRLYRSLLAIATLLAFGVIVLGAYVRLSDAGLGCPDWPGCYGHLISVPDAPHEVAAAREAFPHSPVEAHKAWKEMAHRYAAGTLGALVALIAALAWIRRGRLSTTPLLPTLLLAVVVVQALLGMWTVTLQLKPFVVSAHLLGGMTTLAVLLCLLLSARRKKSGRADGAAASFGRHALWALLALVAQIALGGWVSSNYAALACGTFPSCGGLWLPEMNFAEAFHPLRELGRSAAGATLSSEALTAIHWSHRVGALLVLLLVGSLAVRLLGRPGWHLWGLLLGAALLAQIGLGIAVVLLSLPLPLAVAHNAGAAVLLSLSLAILYRSRQDKANRKPAAR